MIFLRLIQFSSPGWRVRGKRKRKLWKEEGSGFSKCFFLFVARALGTFRKVWKIVDLYLEDPDFFFWVLLLTVGISRQFWNILQLLRILWVAFYLNISQSLPKKKGNAAN